jgi:hypothetical protein
MVLLQDKGRKAFVFMAESCDVGNDTKELQLLKARTARGVSQVDQSSGFTVIHIQALGRGPLRCEQELKDAMS